MQFTQAQLTGLNNTHLFELYPNHCVHIKAVSAVQSLQKASKQAGFDLRLASSFRSFNRQQIIWNNKASGKQTCFNRNEEKLNIAELSAFELADSICFFSAIPGTSRHHWGTDFDIFDANAYQAGQSPALTQSEYLTDGPNYPLYTWLQEKAAEFDFIFPFTSDKNGVSPEPWHISFLPVSHQASSQFSKDHLSHLLNDQAILLSDVILKNIDYFYPKYIGQYHV
ncbi:M15 family metallopeptidase [Catenovulum adriaticum]|uniref:M15 family metallopeptidase n=1 Tax=Catenovulum adriaticum TaxID=2984846 RepID=A0ABY7APF9_9ALTE|nr:M15 family metallopeptidase [Catenovulum sp. TS8]WAJ71450.1 M15 family metallopeptidase [Catenovulum sp. TS8]